MMKSMISSVIAFLVVIFSASSMCGQDINYLFVGELEKGISKSQQLIYRLKFEDGIFTNIEEIHQFRSNKPVLINIRPWEIIEDRFAVSPAGIIYDLQFETILYGGRSGYSFLGTEGPYAYYHRFALVDWENIPREFYYFDIFNGREMQRLTSGTSFWHLPEMLRHKFNRNFSPDGRLYAYFPDSDLSCSELRVKDSEDSDGWKIADGLSVSVPLSSTFPHEPPFLWLDNERILTQKSNGELVIFDIYGRKQDLAKFDTKYEIYNPPGIHEDLRGNIVYTCGHSYLIDLEKMEVSDYLWQPLGYGFQVSSFQDGKDYSLKAFKYMGQEIGQWISPNSEYAVTEGYIAFPYRTEDTPQFDVDGIAVWSRHTDQWTKIELDEFNGFLGWIKDW
ncbi:MAG: hypothetical protein GWN00_15295 [Aliifodinibius sp.]|nr:hypothetical protein [candidate division Zixibacteria bacterium]NIT57537.1 hypothetical protein [Fodinibius sp.]NIW40916.1 hypothetical protein [candidate division Zixibacteria bacterium]NIY26119.1 hypothetical protein [Fodinibius sp.]